jgi:hypothetical protein
VRNVLVVVTVGIVVVRILLLLLVVALVLLDTFGDRPVLHLLSSYRRN